MPSTARSSPGTVTPPDDKQQYKKRHSRRPAERRKRRTVPRGDSVKEPMIVSPSPPSSPSLKQQRHAEEKASMPRKNKDQSLRYDDLDDDEDDDQHPPMNDDRIADPYLVDNDVLHKEDWNEEALGGQQSPVVEEPYSQDELLDVPISQRNPKNVIKKHPQLHEDDNSSETSMTSGSVHQQSYQPSAEDLGRLLQNNLQFDPPRQEVNLTGGRLDAAGNVLDDEGNIIGTVVKDDWSHAAGKTVNEQGEIVDLAGNVYGKVQPATATSSSSSKQSSDDNNHNNDSKKRSGISFSNGNSDDLVVNVDATKGGISFSIHIPRPQ